MDMVAGYWQVRVQKEDIFKTAFVIVWRQYEYLRISFGLCNTPATFQWLMNHVLYDHLGEFVMIYLDDVVIYSKSIIEYVKHLDWIFGQLKWAGLKIKMKKCEFAKFEKKLLGYWILTEGIISDPGKVAIIKALEQPTTIFKFRRFLRAVSFFRKYIQRFKQIAKPLNDMTLVKFENYWIPEMDKAWKELKKRLIETPILKHPNFTKPFILYTDISKKGIGAILAQLGFWSVQFSSVLG